MFWLANQKGILFYDAHEAISSCPEKDSLILTSINHSMIKNLLLYKVEGTQGTFLVTDVLKGPLGCSICAFARTAHSAHSLRSTLLPITTLASFAHFVHGLAHLPCSLSHGTVEIHDYVLTLKTCFTGTNAVIYVTRNPLSANFGHILPCNYVYW